MKKTYTAALILFSLVSLTTGCKKAISPGDNAPGLSSAELAKMNSDDAQRLLGKEAFTATTETLFNRIDRGDLRSVQLLLKAGVSPDSTSPEGFPALVQAVNVDSAPIISALINGGADVNATAPGGFTAIHAAAHDGKIECVLALLDTSTLVVREQVPGENPAAAKTAVDPALVDADGNTALLAAIRSDHPAVALKLLSAGWNARAAGGDGDAALTLAVRKGNEPLMQALIDKGALVNAPNSEGRTALAVAAAEGPPSALTFLLAHGAKPEITDKHGDNAASIAKKSNRPDNTATLESAHP